jgi:anti-sigma-K factor RskA
MFERVTVLDSTGEKVGEAIVAAGQTKEQAIQAWWIDNTEAF